MKSSISLLTVAVITGIAVLAGVLIYFSVRSSQECQQSGGHEEVTSWYWSNSTKTMEPNYNCVGGK